MNTCRGRCFTVILVLLFVITCMVTTSHGDVGGDGIQKPNAAERAIGFLDPLTRWERVKSWAKVTWINYGLTSERTKKAHSHAGDAVKEAFSESIETADHAAKVAGDVVHKTVEKVKRTVSGSGKEEEDSEL